MDSYRQVADGDMDAQSLCVYRVQRRQVIACSLRAHNDTADEQYLTGRKYDARPTSRRGTVSTQKVLCRVPVDRRAASD